MALTWKKVTYKTVVVEDHFACHFIREECIILNAHFVLIRPQKKKGTNKIRTGMHVCMLRYHCNCSNSLVHHISLREICFLISDPRADLDVNI